ncbi:MAG: hypothetical protein AAFR59_06690 [Bacteroidota bacterium]
MNLLDRIGYRGPNYVLGIQVNVQEDTCLLMGLKQEKGELHKKEVRHFQDWEKLWEYLDHRPGVPIVLSIEGDTVSGSFPAGKKPQIQDVLGVKVDKPQDFLVQRLPTQDNQTWMAVTRREPVDEILSKMKAYSQRIVYVSFFDAVASYLIPAIPNYEPSFTYQLDEAYTWRDGLLATAPVDPMPLSKAGLATQIQCKEEELMLYGSLVHFMFSGGRDLEGHEVIQTQRTRVLKALQQIRLGSQMVLGGLLILIILVSVEVFGSWQVEINAQVLIQNQDILDRIDNNHERIQEQQTFLFTSGQDAFQASKLAWHLDIIGQYAPPQMRFKKLLFHPDESQQKKWIRDITRPVDILLMGEAHEASEITTFSQALRMEKAYQEVKIYQSEYDYLMEAHTFTLLIRFVNE